jgi:hypothetical protein
MIVEKQMECRLAGETEVLGENLLQRQFVHHWLDPGLNTGRRGAKPVTNRLSYGVALPKAAMLMVCVVCKYDSMTIVVQIPGFN